MDLQFEKELKNHLKSLKEEYKIITLLNHRNRNQHRVAKWWKFFNIFKRKTFDVIQRIHHILTSKITNVQKTLVRNVNQLYKSLNYFLKKQSKAIYYAFNGVIQLGQFVTLGVVLVGTFAKIQSTFEKLQHLLKSCEYLSITITDNKAKPVVGANTELAKIGNVQPGNEEELGEELGEEVAGPLELSISKENVDKEQCLKVVETLISKEANKKIQSRKTKKSKKKSKNAIDDIFG